MSDLLTPQSGPTAPVNPKAAAKAAKAYAKASRKWYQKKRTWLGGGVLVLIGASAMGAGGSEGAVANDNDTAPVASAGQQTSETGSKPAKKAESPGPTFTVAQENAIETAQNYLDMSAFSREGLIKQLKFEGYTEKDATFAVDTIKPNWKKQAAESAENYLDMTAFSRAGLIKQLEFEGYTEAQAVFGVNQAGL